MLTCFDVIENSLHISLNVDFISVSFILEICWTDEMSVYVLGGCGEAAMRRKSLWKFKKKRKKFGNHWTRHNRVLKFFHIKSITCCVVSITFYLSASGGTVPWMMMISPGCRPPGMGPVYGITWGGQLTLGHGIAATGTNWRNEGAEI